MTINPRVLSSLYQQDPDVQIQFVMTLLYSFIEEQSLYRIDRDFLGFFQDDNAELLANSADIDKMSQKEQISLAINILANAQSKLG